MAVLSLPRYYIIEPTNLCNFKCPICPNVLYSPGNLGSMSMRLFTSIIEQITGTAEVIQLYWMGEPLLCNDIYEMINICKVSTNAKVILSTNGSHLNPKTINALVNAGLDEIIVSVDAADSQEIYGQIRKGGKLTDLISSIDLLLQNKGTLRVTLQFIDLYLNRPEKSKFFEKWKSKDCLLQETCLYSWANQLACLNLASDHLSPVANQDRIPCADLWNKMSIHFNGKISACCFDWNFAMVVGDCNDTALLEIWNGNELQSLRNLHFLKKFHGGFLCGQCDAWATPDEYITLFHLD